MAQTFKLEERPLWNSRFVGLLISVMSLMTSLFILLPPMIDKGYVVTPLGIQLSIFSLLLFLLGMIVSGPFYNYLFDHFTRKRVGQISVLLTVLASFAYMYLDQINWVYGVLFIHGAAFGTVLNLEFSLHIDVSNPKLRRRANRVLVMGLFVAQAVGYAFRIVLYDFCADLLWIYYTSIVLGILSLLTLTAVKVPFRAPLVRVACSLDRFFLPRAFGLSVNVLLFALGTSLAISSNYLVLGISWLSILIGVFLFIIVLFAIPDLLRMYIGLTAHCQRCTINNTLMLTWIGGFILGIVLASYFSTLSLGCLNIVALGVILIAVLMYFTLTRWLYRKLKKREM